MSQSTHRHIIPPALALSFLLLTLAVGTPAIHGQEVADDPPTVADCPHAGGEGNHSHPIASAADQSPGISEFGQGAFAALAEMVGKLDSEPSVDWRRVRLDRLREHLIDMDRVVTTADVEVTELDDGFRARVTSQDPRTAAAIRRMLPAHGRTMDGHRGWRVRVEPPEEDAGGGSVVTVRSDQPSEVIRLKALGFAGFLVSGDHHRRHHWMMVTGGGH